MLPDRDKLSETEDNLRKMAERIQGQARTRLTGDVEVIGSWRTTMQLEMEKNDYQLAALSEVSGYGIRAVEDGRIGWASSNRLRDDRDVGALLDDVALLTRLSPEDADLALPEGNGQPRRTVSVDETFHAKDEQDAREVFVRWIDDTRKAEPRISIRKATLATQMQTTHVRNTRGVDCSHVDCSAVGWMLALGEADGDVTSFNFDMAIARQWSDLPGRLAESSRRLVRRIGDCFGAGKGGTYKGRVLLSPMAAADLVLSPLLFQTNGLNVARAKTRFRDLGQRVASELLNIKHTPGDPDGANIAPFDREGVETSDQAILEAGRLASFCLDTKAAAALNRVKQSREFTSNGCATGGYRTAPSVGVHNVSLLPGAHPWPDLTQALGTGIVINRFSGNVDPVSGQFSGVAKGAQLYEKGKRVRAVTELMVSGNVFDALQKLVAIGAADTCLWMGGTRVPALVMDGVSVVSA